MMVAQKVLQQFLYFSQNQRKCLQLILRLIWNVPLATAVPQNNPFSSVCAGGRQKIWSDDVSLKQWAVTEFHVAEKESVMNIHRW
jgi:hypothetical protein